jgi:hypothetical protein
MQLPTYFADFLTDIRPDDDQLQEYQEGHKTLRQRMHDDEEISKLLVSDFLQGSYRRATAIQPEGDQKSDVDIVAVTTILDSEDVDDVRGIFERFLNRFDDYKGHLEPKTHSIGISLTKVEMDLVVTSAPSEAVEDALKTESRRTEDLLTKTFSAERFSLAGLEDLTAFRESGTGEWKNQPLRIPNFDDGTWGDTDPLTQIAWTVQRNADCNSHYVNVVKALKWWRRTKCPKPKHPKGYPVEHIIGDYCTPGISSVADGVVSTLEGIRDCPVLAGHRVAGTTPYLPDRGIPAHNVWKRIEFEDFDAFMDQVSAAATIAREAYDISDDVPASARRWHDLFGDPFHSPDDGGGEKRTLFVPPTKPATPRHGRFG